jgi:penicillin amidase
VLDDAALRGNSQRTEFKRVLSEDWTGHASVDAAGYRLARTFLFALDGELWGEYADYLNQSRAASARVLDRTSFDVANPRWPAVLARMLDAQPAGWLPEGRSWRSVQLDAVDRSIRELTQSVPGNGTLADATWGRRNASDIAHPFAGLVPGLGKWLRAPLREMPGDENMPRVAGPHFGQSERMVVSPGRESEALFSMPGGQSGHPLSPYFLAGHETWAAGELGPLLPGKAEHSLRFLQQRH